MVLPNAYIIGSELGNPTFTYVDWVTNTGYALFYAGATKDATSTKYHLNTLTFACPSTATGGADSWLGSTQCTHTGSPAVKVADLDFDSSAFSIPVKVGGTLISNLPFSAGITSDWNDTTGTAYAVIDFKKFSAASVETSLISVTSNTVTWDVDPGIADKYFSTQSTIPVTPYAIGDKIRITVEIWMADLGGTGNPVLTLGHNPANTAIASVAGSYKAISAGYSAMKFWIPFRINL